MMMQAVKYFLLATLAAASALRAGAQNTIEGGDIQEVVVTGTGTQHLLKDAPVQTEVIGRKMLQNYAGRSLEDILSGLSASFDFNEGDMGSQMQINGLGNDYILILVDGKRMHGDVGGQNDLGQIDPHNIERIEVVKGASSALYGSDAIAGVINIITRKHNEGLLLENTTRGGSYQDLRQHNGIGVRLGKLSSYTNFQLQHSDGWQNTSIEDPRQTEFLITDSRNKTVNRHTNWQLAEHLSYAFSPRFEWYADGSTYWKRIYRPMGKYPSTDVNTFDLKYRNNSLSTGAKYVLDASGNDFLTFDASWDQHAYFHAFTATTLTDGYVDGVYTPYYPYFPGQQELQSDQQRTMATLKGVFTLPASNRLSAGLEWRYDWLKAPMRVAGGQTHDNTGAIYVQDEYNPTEWLNLTGGLRLTKNQRFGYKLTPKLSGMLSLGTFRLRGTWSQGFKTPTPKELAYRYVREMNGTYLYLGNHALKPQTSDYYSLGAEYSFANITLNVSGYYNDVRNMITLVTIPRAEAPGDLIVQYDPVKTHQYKNLETAKTYGVDFNARYASGEWTAGVGYSYLDTDANLYDANHETMRKMTIDGMVHHKANVNVAWNHAFGKRYSFGAALFGRLSTKRYYQINGNGKGYQTWRLNTTHDFSAKGKASYRLEAGVDNIFNYVDRTYHGLHLGTTTPGTTLYASFTVRFSQGKKLKNTYKPTKNNYSNEED